MRIIRRCVPRCEGVMHQDLDITVLVVCALFEIYGKNLSNLSVTSVKIHSKKGNKYIQNFFGENWALLFLRE